MADVLALCFAAVTYHELFKLAARALASLQPNPNSNPNPNPYPYPNPNPCPYPNPNPYPNLNPNPSPSPNPNPSPNQARDALASLQREQWRALHQQMDAAGDRSAPDPGPAREAKPKP